MRNWLLPQLILLIGWSLGCAPNPSMAPKSGPKECHAEEYNTAYKALARAQEAYIAESFDASLEAAQKSQDLCPTPLAGFYLGASQFQLAKKSGDERDPRFAEARCSLEDALADNGSIRVSDVDSRNEGAVFIAEATKHGAARLTVHAAAGALQVRSGDGRVNRKLPLPRTVSTCLMPGPYDILVTGADGTTNGKGEETIQILPGKDFELEFELDERGRNFGVAGAIVLLTVGSITTVGWTIGAKEQGDEIQRCDDAPSLGLHCINDKQMEANASKILMIGMGIGFAAWGIGIAGTTAMNLGLKSPQRVSPKGPSPTARLGSSCFVGLGGVSCNWTF